MATGDVTSTYEGTFDPTTAAILTELNTLNTGAATSKDDTKSIILVPAGINGNLVHIFTIARAA